ncbi:MAG TPA: sugar ABC transporter ATP-binding protein [Solirubrobacteraceae bacterium]|nr:sugar ABC transporter ATP-binding protein [Solirubrobacteraceae bacterium]
MSDGRSGQGTQEQRTELEEHPILAVSHVAKSFGAVAAISDASLALHAGEAHGLVGENGAGKSTLVKMLAGVHQPDSGQITIEGVPVTLGSPGAARDAGIAVIYQEPTMFPDLSVAENVFMGRMPRQSAGRLDRESMRRQVISVLEMLDVRLDPDRAARGLSIADQQIAEIAKALTLDARVLVMDEPTAALSAAEVERLTRVIETLRGRGAAVLFISHRLDEIFTICQSVTVMRDGRSVLARPAAELTSDELVRAMVGRDVEQRQLTRGAIGDVVLSVDRLTQEGNFVDISFELRAGEIVGLGGLVGAGRTEIAQGIFGIERYDAGSVTVAGQPLKKGSPSAAMQAGIALVPEDRRQHGLVMDESIERNVLLASLASVTRRGLIAGELARQTSRTWLDRLQVKYGRLSDPVTTLSGGNQQKVVLAKWLRRNPRVIIVDEPTRGIDVGTKAEVHRLLEELAEQGVAVLVISSELPELLLLADRILVIREGRLVREIPRAAASEESVIAAAAGAYTEQAA